MQYRSAEQPGLVLQGNRSITIVSWTARLLRHAGGCPNGMETGGIALRLEILFGGTHLRSYRLVRTVQSARRRDVLCHGVSGRLLLLMWGSEVPHLKNVRLGGVQILTSPTCEQRPLWH